jgi:drug/metabolite transporter (DMT)-like permease
MKPTIISERKDRRVVYIFVAISIVAMTAAQLLLKKGLLAVGQAPQDWSELLRFFVKSYTNIYVIAAVILTIVTALAWMQAASKVEISYIYPFMAVSYILVALFSIWMFHENVTLLRWVGIGVVCLGVFLVSRS